MKYGKKVFIAIDQLCNSILAGWPDETLSSRAYRWKRDGVRKWPCKVIDKIALLFGDKEHCYMSYVSEQKGRQRPPELREQ